MGFQGFLEAEGYDDARANLLGEPWVVVRAYKSPNIGHNYSYLLITTYEPPSRLTGSVDLFSRGNKPRNYKYRCVDPR